MVYNIIMWLVLYYFYHSFRLAFFISNLYAGENGQQLRINETKWFDSQYKEIIMKQKLFLSITTLLLLFSPIGAIAEGVTYVNQNASGSNSGNSWQNAYSDLNVAIDMTVSGEIWVAAGSYKPSQGGARDATFTMKSNVALYGGFSGSETVLEQRNPELYHTILNGDLNGDDVPRLYLGAWTSFSMGDNSQHVVTAINTDSTAILDGFSILHGYGSVIFGSANPVDSGVGGGILIDEASPTIRNIIIEGNVAVEHGGAVYIRNGSPSFVNTLFRNNVSGHMGGAVSIIGLTSDVSFTDSRFEGNAAIQSFHGHGGAIYQEFTSTLRISGSTFVSNFAGFRNGNGADSNFGSATSTGGAIHSWGNLAIDHSHFLNNRSHFGGAIYTGSSNTSRFLKISNSLFSGNKVTTVQTPIQSIGGLGGAMAISHKGFSEIINATISGNSGQEKAAGLYIGADASTSLDNSIVWGNNVLSLGSSGEDPIPAVKRQISNDGDLTISYSVIEGLWVPTPGEDLPNPNKYPGSIDQDPLFVDAKGPDGTIGTLDDNLQLSVFSPAIDAGNNMIVSTGDTTDLSGNSRFFDDLATVDSGQGTVPIVDMGAYEFVSQTTGNESPVAVASATPNTGNAPLPVDFSSTNSYDPDNQIVSFSWDFGDDTTATGSLQSHTYNKVGTYNATLTVEDNQGATDSTTIVVTVQGSAPVDPTPVPDETKPTVTILYPVAGNIVSGTVKILTDALDNIGIKKVIFKIGNQKIGQDFTAPFQLEWNTTAFADSSHTVKVIAVDLANNRKKATVKVTVNNSDIVNPLPTPTEPASVNIISPEKEATVSGVIDIIVETTSNISEILVDEETLLGTVGAGGGTVMWDTTTVSNGNHEIMAISIIDGVKIKEAFEINVQN